MIYWLFIVIVGYCCLYFVDGSSKYTMMFLNTPQSWTESQIQCSGKGGRLLNISPNVNMTDLYETLKKMEINENTRFWIGNHRTTSKWIQIQGCYNFTNVGHMKEIEFEENSPGLCQEHCFDYEYFSVQSTTCFCLRNRPKNNHRVSASNCNLKCAGDQNLDCGSLRRHSNIYKTDSNVSGSNTMCASLDCETNSILYTATNCQTYLMTMCDSFKKENAYPWMEAYLTCRGQGLYLLGNAFDECSSKNHSNYINGNYWVGVFKHHYNSMDMGKVEVTMDIMQCSSCYLSNSEVICNRSNSCVDGKFPSICQILKTIVGKAVDSKTILHTAFTIKETYNMKTNLTLAVTLPVVILATIVTVVILGFLIRFDFGVTAGVTGRQGMLTPPNLIPPLSFHRRRRTRSKSENNPVSQNTIRVEDNFSSHTRGLHQLYATVNKPTQEHMKSISSKPEVMTIDYTVNDRSQKDLREYTEDEELYVYDQTVGEHYDVLGDSKRRRIINENMHVYDKPRNVTGDNPSIYDKPNVQVYKISPDGYGTIC